GWRADAALPCVCLCDHLHWNSFDVGVVGLAGFHLKDAVFFDSDRKFDHIYAIDCVNVLTLLTGEEH
ncbi:MAG: hypothetical protein ACJAZ1_003664, partial [Yoonia sp.]